MDPILNPREVKKYFKTFIEYVTDEHERKGEWTIIFNDFYYLVSHENETLNFMIDVLENIVKFQLTASKWKKFTIDEDIPTHTNGKLTEYYKAVHMLMLHAATIEEMRIINIKFK